MLLTSFDVLPHRKHPWNLKAYIVQSTHSREDRGLAFFCISPRPTRNLSTATINTQLKGTTPPSWRKPTTASKRLLDSCVDNLKRLLGGVRLDFLIHLSLHEPLQTCEKNGFPGNVRKRIHDKTPDPPILLKFPLLSAYVVNSRNLQRTCTIHTFCGTSRLIVHYSGRSPSFRASKHALLFRWELPYLPWTNSRNVQLIFL